MVERPEPETDWPRRLCLDKGYDNKTGWGVIVDYEYEPRIQLIRDLRPPLARGRAVLATGEVVRQDRLGGLIHEYARRAA